MDQSTLALSKSEKRLLEALEGLVDRWGEINATMVELGQITGYGRTALSKAAGSLQAAGLIRIVRTKRNFGKLYKNRYFLLQSEKRTSTADYSDLDSQLDITTVTTKVINTSYLLCAKAQEEGDMVNKWEDDEGLGGFGLLEGELPAAQKPKPVSKRDPKTRHQRPKAEWTTWDVSSEFAYQLYQNVRGIPGLVNISKLAPVLGKYRKDHGTTALYELEVLEMLVGDERNLVKVKKEPHNAWKLFLRMMATHGNQATEQIIAETETAIREEFLFASDGKRFDNSMPGRVALENHEQKLRRA